MRHVLLAFVLVLASGVSAHAAGRFALVIGNDAYDEIPVLRNAVNDATAIASALDDQGYRVMLSTDATRRDMNRTLSEFAARLQPGDTALIFFAGHGVEIAGENYLLPTDVVAPQSGDGLLVASESIALSVMLDRVRATGARTTLAIIDACRENPFTQTTGRSIGGTRGLGRVLAPEGTFVIFSAGVGQLALDRLSDDDPNPNSVFTRALLPRLSRPGLELRALVSEVRTEVRDLALSRNHSQFPAYYDELLGDFYLVPAAAPPAVVPRSDGAREDLARPAPAAGTDAAIASPGQAATSTVRQDFDLAREIGSASALQAFVDKHAASGDAFALGLARDMLAALSQPESATSPQRDTPRPVPPEDPVADTRALLRASQEELNRLGCNAGVADGISGPRTRAAWNRFLQESASALSADDLGSATALDVLRAATGRVCLAGAVAQPAQTASARTTTPSAPTAPSLSGTWAYSAKCPLFIRVTGTMRLSSTGSETYAGPIADSIGQSGTTSVRVLGQTIQGSNNWGHIVETWSGTLASDGRSFNLSSSTLCTATVSKR
ncbi:MAG: caspase family protein [Pseudomonadota bacterium]